MHRIILMNKHRLPTREELSTTEKEIGKSLLGDLNLEYCGYVIVEGTGKMATQWRVTDDQFNQALDFAETANFDSHEVRFEVDIELQGKYTSRRFA